MELKYAVDMSVQPTHTALVTVSQLLKCKLEIKFILKATVTSEESTTVDFLDFKSKHYKTEYKMQVY